ncbi:MAG: hypothetical protein AAGG48_29370 [Planctomycetota bacterium]
MKNSAANSLKLAAEYPLIVFWSFTHHSNFFVPQATLKWPYEMVPVMDHQVLA